MKTFKIHSANDVHIDDYEQGELDRVNGYTVTNEVEANVVWEAIEKYCETTLYYDFKQDNASKIDVVEYLFFYSVVVEVENLEANERQIEKWKQGKEKLYSSNITITVLKLQKLSFNFYCENIY